MDIGVYCLNVGQGSCAAIIDPHPSGSRGAFQASVIDTGVDGDALADWLRSVGVQHIPLIALTHNDEDHVRGLSQLVHRFRPTTGRGRPRIGRVLFLIDRDPAEDIPYYLDAENWAAAGLIGQIGRLEAPRTYRPGMGEVLVQEPETSYRLHCAFPTMHQTEAAVRRTAAHGPRLGHGPNDTSGVIRLARPVNPRRTRVLFGGDLNYPGWNSMRDRGLDVETDVLIAPHHGAPRGATSGYGPVELAADANPRYVLFSAGTHQRHVRPATEATARHPLPEVVGAFRSQGSVVLCTQFTRRCHDTPETVPGGTVLPLPSLTQPHVLHPSGTACAGTVMIVIRDSGHLSLSRLADHQSAVDDLITAGHHPLCRL